MPNQPTNHNTLVLVVKCKLQVVCLAGVGGRWDGGDGDRSRKIGIRVPKTEEEGPPFQNQTRKGGPPRKKSKSLCEAKRCPTRQDDCQVLQLSSHFEEAAAISYTVEIEFTDGDPRPDFIGLPIESHFSTFPMDAVSVCQTLARAEEVRTVS